MKRFTILLAVIVLLVPLFACCIPQASATVQIYGYSSYTATKKSTLAADAIYASPYNFSDFIVDFGIDTTYNITVKNAAAYIQHTSSNSEVKMVILNSNNTIYAVSESRSLETAIGWYYFNFSEITLDPNEINYTLGLVVMNGTFNWHTGTAAVNEQYYADTSNSWSTPVDPTDAAQSNYYPMAIYLLLEYNADLVSPTPAPTYPLPTGGSYDTTDTNLVINTFVGYLIPLLLFLIPALILGWLTRWQKWPILIGLAIGSGLTYLFLGTQYVWLVLLVTIGIGASAYQSSRGSE